MVARFHEGCLHRRVDGKVEEFIFTQASRSAIASWASQVEQILTSGERPTIIRWLVDLRLSGPLTTDDISRFLNDLEAVPAARCPEVRIAYLVEQPTWFDNIFAGIGRIFGSQMRFKWFSDTREDTGREAALEWLLARTLQ